MVASHEKVRAELAEWKRTVLTTRMVYGPPPMLRTVAELVLG